MPVVKVSELQPDQVVGNDVMNQGQLLLKKGVKLTAGLIKTLASRGVDKVYIVDPTQTTSSGTNVVALPAFAQKAHQIVDKRFCLSASLAQHPVVMATKEYCYRLVIDQMIKRGDV